MREIQIGPNDGGQRLDKFLQKALPGLPVALMYKYIRKKRIKLNGKTCKIGYKLVQGDTLTFYIPEEFFEERAQGKDAFLNAPPQVSVVYEDDNLLLADKPPGLLAHEGEDGSADTLIHRIQHYLYQKGEYSPETEHAFAPALCNRIDRNTGGIVIAAKNFETLQLMSEKIRLREISKVYLCLVHGVPEKRSALLKGYHTKDSATNTVQIHREQREGSKTALTRYRVLQTVGGQSLLEVELLTGRTHQIRAHMASIGHPLVGDTKYGLNRMNKGLSYPYQALCSHRITFTFSEDNGHLDYLKNQTFQVEHVPFLTGPWARAYRQYREEQV